MLLLSGGLLDGDETSIQVCVEAGAQLALRTQAASQVHAGTSQRLLEATVGESATFRYVPHVVVPHANASYCSTTSVRMQRGARVLLAEPLSPGRIEHGELFAYTQLVTKLDVWLEGTLVARERALVSPDPTLRGAVFGPFTHTAAAYMLGSGDAYWACSLPGVALATTALARGGWYLRAMSQRAADIDVTLAKLSAAWWRACEVHKAGST